MVSGRVRAVMIFTIRQISEKAVEHRNKQFFIFVDLRKAYNSVPCEALWKVLGKLGMLKC